MFNSSHWFFLLLLLWHCFSETQGFGKDLMKIPKQDPAPIECTVGLMKKYFRSGEALSGSVVYVTSTKAARYMQKSFVQTLHADTRYPWSIVVKNSKTNANEDVLLNEKPQCYFFVIENIEDEDINEIFDMLKSTINWNPLAQFVVFVMTVEESEEEMTDIMIEVLLLFMNKKIFNVNVLGRTEGTNFIYAKTVFPYHPDNNCGNRVIAIETVDICDYQGGDDDDDADDDDEAVEDAEETDKDGNEAGDVNGEKENENVNGKDDSDRINNEKSSDEMEHGEAENDQVVGELRDERSSDERRHYADEFLKKVSYQMALKVSFQQQQFQTYQKLEKYNGENRERDKKSSISFLQSKEIRKMRRPLELKQKHNTNNFRVSQSTKLVNTMKRISKTFKSHSRLQPNYKRAIFQVHKVRQRKLQLHPSISSLNTTNIQQISKTEDDTDDHIPVPRQYGIANVQKLQGNFTSEANGKINCPQKVNYSEAETRISKSYFNDLNNMTKSLSLTDLEDPEESKVYIEEMYPALFLDKFPKDLSGCPLVAGYRPWEPYIFVEQNSHQDASTSNETTFSEYKGFDSESYGFESESYGGQNEESNEDEEEEAPKIHLNGIEYKMIETIGERLHISIIMHVENSNLFRLFQQLMDGDIEMIIGGIDEDPIMSQYVSSTIPYHQDDLTWCVAKADRSHNLFNFLATFKLNAWLLTILFILTASLSIRMSQLLLGVKLKSIKNYFTACLSVMGTTLSQAIDVDRLPASLKLCFGTLFFMSLMFSNVYQSFLVSTLTNPKSSHQISLTKEIYERHMQVMGSVDNVRHLNKEGEIFRYVREQFQMCYNIEECLQRTAKDAKLAVAVSRQHSFYNPRIPRDSLYCFDRNENIYVYLVTMLLPKKFHLLHKINPVIQHIIESGHMQKWARDLDMRRKIIEAINRAHEEKFKSLTVGQVAGPFALIGFFLTIASLVFGLELLAYWLVKRHRTRLKIAKYLHRKFM